MKLPKFWKESLGIAHKSYLVCRPGPDNSLIVTTFENEVKHGKKVRNRKGKRH